jgi:hypothetical protein
MAQSKITLIGLESFLDPNSVFDELTLPAGIDLETLKGTIFLRCQEFELLYPDPEFMRSAVKIWGMKNYWTFNKWVELINKQYDPLYNKDYYEEYEDTHEGSESGSGTSSQTDDHTRTDNLKSETDGTVTHAEKAFNDTYMVDTSKDTTDGEVKHTGTQRDAGSLNGSYSDSKDDSYTNNHTYHGYGNIGITSAQELFQREAEVARFNLYEQIADLFCQEFCIMVY